MSQLPARPDLDQLRRQARELYRAALSGDAGALRRLRQVSGTVALPAAQLAIARAYGFASWPQLKAEVEHRRELKTEVEHRRARAANPAGEAAGAGADQAVPGSAAVPPPKSWKQMRDWAAHLLRSRTGQDVGAWNRRVAEAGLPDEQALRAWLDGQGVTGYGQALLVWERFGYPDFLTAEADELIAGQYADRLQLRPVLDAVLAALPVVGPATVQARKTIVSLVTPRRTFAVIQATTKTRVDLGLRLEHERPAGRLLAARDLGAATVRIALIRPEDVDAEVLGWLRRAYTENAAPPPPRRPSRRAAPEFGALTVVIEGASLPGLIFPSEDGGQYRNLHIGLATKSKERPTLAVPGKPWRAADPVPGDAPSARWEMPVTVRHDTDGFDFSGPYVRGARDDRNLFLAWGDVRDDGTMRLVRGSKIKLTEVDPRLVEEAMRPGHRLVARILLTGTAGEPGLAWSAEAAPGQPGSG